MADEKNLYTLGEKIIQVPIEDEMRDSYIDYAMSVIVGRALPDVRDGLKPVHRRILYAMQELGLVPHRPYKKSARVVGEVLGKFHPHGDLAVYETLVRMAQDFSLRYPLVDGQGNFGSVDGDSAAAMRYCVTGDTLVVTERGLIPIKDLSETGSEEIRVSVLSRDQKIHSASKWFASGEHPTIRITTRGGFSLRGSYNHPVLTWRSDGPTGQPGFQWKLLSQLRVGEIAVIDRTTDRLWPESALSLAPYRPRAVSPRVEIKVLPDELNEDLAFILGALVSEGTVKEREIEFCNSDPEWMREFEERWQRVFPDTRLHRFSRRPNSYGKKPYFTCEIHSCYVIEFLRNIGLAPVRSRGKTIPWSILRSPRSVAAAFLRAYFEGDGGVSSSGKKMVELSCVSTSEALLHQIQTFLLRFGIASTKRFDRYRGNSKLYVRGLKNYQLFQAGIGFVSERKKGKLAQAVVRYHKDFSRTDFVPFIGHFARSRLDRDLPWKGGRDFTLKHNFDRYANLEKSSPRVVATLEPGIQPLISALFEHLLETQYLFDAVVKIEDGGPAQVYSLKVESECHSFVGNGFINHNTEVRLATAAEELLSDIDKGTVDFVPNFDESLEEPSLLPARLPNLLVNGSSGIAVGMATNIPPHNLKEIVEGMSLLIDNPNVTAKELMKVVKGPDFPTGGVILGRDGIRSAYETGRGRILVRAKAVIETGDHKKDAIVVTEIPYQVNKASVIESIARLVEEKKIEGIHDLRDESDREGMRIVIELKKDAIPQIVLNQLYKHTQLQETFGAILLALVDGQPRVLNLKELLEQFVEFRVEVVTRRTRFELDRAEKRAHILEGLKIAIANLDKVIKTIRQAKDPEIAKQELVKNFKLTEVQAKAILEMQLQRLTALEREKIDEEYLELIKKIEYYRSVLKSRSKILGIIKEESLGLAKKYGDERRTQIVAEEKDIEIEDLIAEEDVLITISHAGYIKRTPVSLYRRQRRGGVGVTGGGVKEEAEDFIEYLFLTSTHDSILFFTNKGRVYWRKAYEIPQASRQARGKAIVNFLSLGPEETVSNFLQVKEFDEKRFVLMVTKQGTIKKTGLALFSRPRSSGIVAIKLHAKDELVATRITGGNDQIFLATRTGQAIRFSEKQVREMGRSAAGVRGIRFKRKDEVIAMEIVDSNATVLTVTSLGFGKKSHFKDYRLQSRGGKGVINIKCTPKNGEAVSVLAVKEGDEAILVTTGGMVVRCPVNQVRTSGRAAQGVRVIRLREKDHVASAARVVARDEEEEEEKEKEKPSKK